MLPIPKNKTNPLRCFICGKTFEKEKSTRRHQFYCRSRVLAPAPSSPRKRSCQACTAAKTRCEMKGSTCTRCEARGIKCELRPVKTAYPRDFGGALQLRPVTNRDEEEIELDPSNENASSLLQEDDGAMDHTSLVTYKHPTSPFIPMDWNDPAMQFDMSTPLIPAETPYHQIPFPSESVSALASSSSASKPSPASNSNSNNEIGYELCNRTSTTQPFLQLTTTDALSNPSASDPQRAFEPKKPKSNNNNGNSSANANVAFLMRIICSYPDMMLRRQTFPPFIHAQCTPGENADEDLPEALSKCMEIAWMFKMRHTFSRNAWWVWNQIRKEHDRLWDERHSNDKWELLASWQSLMIYSIMRIIEGEADYTDFDDLLLLSMNAINTRLLEILPPSTTPLRHPSEESGGPPPLPWKEWIFYESHRRTIAVYRILSVVVSLETAAPCKPLSGLMDAPLPTKKRIWDAQEEEAWRAEYELDVAGRNGRRLLTNGDLMRLQFETGGVNTSSGGGEEGEMGIDPVKRVEGWDEWYAGMDGLGTMIMIAATL